MHDMELYNLNQTNFSDIDPDQFLSKHQIRTFYHSSSTFKQLRNSWTKSNVTSIVSFFHNNIRSLKRNLENLQVQLLDELNYHFIVIETKITHSTQLNFKTEIPGYEFEYVPTPLASGGVGMYIDNMLEYIVLEKCSDDNSEKKNINCGVIYRQHNNPNCFMAYQMLENLLLQANLCASWGISTWIF